MIGRKLRDLPIGRKLFALAMAASMTASFLTCVVFVAYDRVSVRSSLVHQLSTQAEIIGSNSTAALLFNDADAAEVTLRALASERRILGAAIYDRRGQRFARYAAGSLPLTVPVETLMAGEAQDVRFELDRVQLLKPIMSEREPVGVVALEASLDELDTRLLRYVTLALGVFALSLLVAALIAARLQRAVSRPILELASVARRISEDEDYGVRARREAGDETGVLVDAFNAMLTQIERRDSTLTLEIAERKRTEAELATARDAAMESSRLKSAFLANMSHEIRTPLNVILGYNDLIESALEERGDESQRPFVEAVRRAGQRLTNTVHGILDFSKIESGVFDVHPRTIQLGPFLERLTADFRVLAREKRIELTVLPAAADVVVRFDEYCLSHGLSNLLDNAVKFTESGGVVVSTILESDGGVRIAVQDTGMGIDSSFLAHLCEPFMQEQSGYTRGFEGSGLGLALTKNFVELNGARLEIRSAKKVGSTFTIAIPPDSVVEVLHPAAAHPPPAASQGDAGRSGGVPPHDIVSLNSSGPTSAAAKPASPGVPKSLGAVLVVEDDPETQAFMQMLLRNRCHVLIAATAAEARQRLASHAGDIRAVLMDLSLRGPEDGLALTRWLRSHPRWSRLPIIATTAHALGEDRERALSAGCDAYLAKPIDRRELFAMLAAIQSDGDGLSSKR